MLRLGCGSALTEWNTTYEGVEEDIGNVLFVNEYGGFERWISCRWIRPLRSVSISNARTRMKKPNIKTMLGCEDDFRKFFYLLFLGFRGAIHFLFVSAVVVAEFSRGLNLGGAVVGSATDNRK